MNHQPRKRFGQNFLHDPGIIRRIVEAIRPALSDHLVEIGPGQGAITKELLPTAGRLDAVELDRDLIAPLQQMCAGLGELRIHNGDALRFDFRTLADDGRELRLVGNLPYNISTPLLFHLLDQSEVVSDMHFMLQKEVVERLAARPGGKDYGRLSVMVQTRCKVTPLFTIGAGAFRPAPKVESAFVRLTPFRTPAFDIADKLRFAELVQRAFSQRRKTLRNALAGLVPDNAWAAAGVAPGARAEQLSIGEFVALANVISLSFT